MSTEDKTVESKGQSAASEQKIEETSNQNTQEVDYEAENAKLDLELEKTRKERDNYKRGLLKAKGKLPDEETDTPPEGWREEARQIAREEFLVTKEADLQSKKDALVVKQAKELKELRTALKNRGQIQSSGQGSNEDKPEVRVESVLSKDQISSFKVKGWSDAKIEAFKANLTLGVNKSSIAK